MAAVRNPGHESVSYLQSPESQEAAAGRAGALGPPGGLRTLSPPHGDHQPCAAGTLPLLH